MSQVTKRATLLFLLLNSRITLAQVPGKGPSKWSFEARYGSAEYASAAATLFLKEFQSGRYVELSFRPTGAPEFGAAYDVYRDSSQRGLVGIAFQPVFTRSTFPTLRFRIFPLGRIRSQR